LRAGEKPRGPARRLPGRQAVHDREIELIDHERLVRQSLAVLRSERTREAAPARRRIDGYVSPAHDVRPECNLRACDVPPEDIEPLVPLVDGLIISRLPA